MFAGDNCVLPHISKSHELVCFPLTTNRSCVRLDTDIVQTTTFQNATVSCIHRLIGTIKFFPIGSKRVRIFHDKFTTAQQSKSRTAFIPELGSDLVQREWQLTIRVHLIPR
ncbi:hypothetical protein D3C74_367340 [compost metagenome]